MNHVTGIAIAAYTVRKHFTSAYEYDHSLFDNGPGMYQHGGSEDTNASSQVHSLQLSTLTHRKSSYGTVDNVVGESYVKL
jgi:hypothetical protein